MHILLFATWLWSLACAKLTLEGQAIGRSPFSEGYWPSCSFWECKLIWFIGKGAATMVHQSDETHRFLLRTLAAWLTISWSTNGAYSSTSFMTHPPHTGLLSSSWSIGHLACFPPLCFCFRHFLLLTTVKRKPFRWNNGVEDMVWHKGFRCRNVHIHLLSRNPVK